MTKQGENLLIFEGVELAGKSYLINLVYDYLENKYNSNRHILNGCHWFNSDVGVFGTLYGVEVINQYIKIAGILKNENVIFEKLYISDQVYREIYFREKLDYSIIEDNLLSLGAKIVLCTVKPDESIFKKRLKERLNLYPHYKRIAQEPKDYIKQQEKYLEVCEKSKLPVLNIDLTELPNPSEARKILRWIKEREAG